MDRGALRGRSDEWLTQLLRRCVTAGLVDFTTGDKPMVELTPAGAALKVAAAGLLDDERERVRLVQQAQLTFWSFLIGRVGEDAAAK